MSRLASGDLILAGIGLLVVFWCGGLVLYAVGSALRSKRSSLDKLTAAFGTLLIILGERLREQRKA